MSERFDVYLRRAIVAQGLGLNAIAEMAAVAQAGKDGGAHSLNILLAFRALQLHDDAYLAWHAFIDAMRLAKARHGVADEAFLNFTWFGVIAQRFFCARGDVRGDFELFMVGNGGLYERSLMRDIFVLCKSS